MKFAIMRNVVLAIVAISARATLANESLAPAAVFDFVDAGGNRPAVVSGVAVSPDGALLAAVGDDHVVRVYDTQRMTQVRRFDEHRDWVRGVAFAPAGDRLVTVGNDCSYCVFCPQDGRLIKAQRGGEGALRAVAIDAEGELFATVGYQTHAQICRLTGEATERLDCPCRDTCAACISVDGTRLAVGGRNGRVRLFDLSNAAAPPLDIEASTRRVRALAFSGDGGRLAVGGDGPEVKFFDTTTGGEVAAWPTRPAKVFCLRYIDDNHLAVGGTDNTIHIWNITSQTIERQLAGHTGTVTSLSSDASGRLLASGSFDTTVRLWNLDPQASNLAKQQTEHPVR
jgi:WD40 repeat protein